MIKHKGLNRSIMSPAMSDADNQLSLAVETIRRINIFRERNFSKPGCDQIRTSWHLFLRSEGSPLLEDPDYLVDFLTVLADRVHDVRPNLVEVGPKAELDLILDAPSDNIALGFWDEIAWDLRTLEEEEGDGVVQVKPQCLGLGCSEDSVSELPR